jgi:flagellar basal body-associated protein FliL
MKKWLFRLFWIPVLIVAVLFMVANRQPVSISLDPFNASEPALTTPAFFLWVWLMLMLFVGFAAGAAGMWISGRPKRVEARVNRKTVKEQRKEITRLETRLREAETGRAASGSVPATEPPPLLESEDA